MTNIIALRQGHEPSTTNPVVMMTDSMGSAIDYQFKIDNMQKLFSVGPHLMAVTWAAGPHEELVDIVKQSEEHLARLSAEDAAQQVSAMAQDLNHGMSVPMQWLWSGPARDGVGLYLIDFMGPPGSGHGDNHGMEVRPNIIAGNFFNQGAGSRFGTNLLNAAQRLGFSPRYDTLTDTVATVHDLMTSGASDMTVNDRLQLGVVTLDGTVTIYHPEVEFKSMDDRIEQLRKLVGYTATEPDYKNIELFEKVRVANRAAQGLVTTFYGALMGNLSDYSHENKSWRSISTGYADDEVAIEVLDRVKELRKESRERLTQGIEAFMLHDPLRMRAYYDQEVERRREILDSFSANL